MLSNGGEGEFLKQLDVDVRVIWSDRFVIH